MAEPSVNPSGPPHAARMPHTHTTHAGKDSLAGDNMDAPAACAVPFRTHCGGVVTRTRNVSEYMLALALRLVLTAMSEFSVAHVIEFLGYTDFGQERDDYILQMIRNFFTVFNIAKYISVRKVPYCVLWRRF